MSTEKSAGFTSGGRITVFELLIFKTKESSFPSGIVIVRGGGQVSRSVTMGALTGIVTGGFNSFFFSRASGCFGLLLEQEKIMKTVTIKKKYRISVWYIMFTAFAFYLSSKKLLYFIGNSIINSEPSPSFVSTFNSPPCALMISWLNDKPNPVSCSVDLVVKKD